MPVAFAQDTQPLAQATGVNVTLYIIVGIAAVLLIIVIGIYNSLVRLKIKVDEGWADIDTQLKRRYDLLPNLVETVKGYAKHEKTTLESVIDLRGKAMHARTPGQKAVSENMITDALKTIFALAENYPDLKANQNFLDLQGTLREIEEHIQMSRRYYNGTVRDYNTSIQVFPNNIFAGPLGFTKREFFEVGSEAEREAVKVSFKE